jgi:hypothetical protein
MTVPAWSKVTTQVAALLTGALAHRPRLSRRSLVTWARGEARRAAGVGRLSTRAAQEIDALVDQAIADASR